MSCIVFTESIVLASTPEPPSPVVDPRSRTSEILASNSSLRLVVDERKLLEDSGGRT